MPHDVPSTAKRRATSYDVAQAAGVAQSTVSRCFTPDSNISPATRERVRAIAASLGYVPNALARSLITQRSNMVAVIATRFTMRGNPDLIYTLGETLAAAGKSVMLVTVPNDLPDEEALRATLEYPIDGLISCALLADDTVRQFLTRGVAMLFYNRSVQAPRIDWIKTDNAEAAADLARRMHRAGHRRFVCVAGPADAPVSRERTGGFTRRLAALGVDETPVLHADYAYDGGKAAFLAHLATYPAPDAVFCANDQLAMGVLDACRFDLKLDVPGDISVAGFDDVPEAARPSYGLTSVRQDSAGMARSAVEMLLTRIANPRISARRVMVPGELIVRGSTTLA
jgi:DNA-binding LacI/PurR family transcriptional regulator